MNIMPFLLMCHQTILLYHWISVLMIETVILVLEPFTKVLIQCTNQLILIFKYRMTVSLLARIILLITGTFSVVVSKGKWHPLMERKTFRAH